MYLYYMYLLSLPPCRSFDEVIDRFADMHLNFSHGVDADNNPEHNCEIDEPIHIVNIAIQYKELKSDKDLAEMFLGFCRERVRVGLGGAGHKIGNSSIVSFVSSFRDNVLLYCT